jgi:hypothetical protein
MGLIPLVLLLVLVFAAAGFALHALGAEHSWYRVQKK